MRGFKKSAFYFLVIIDLILTKFVSGSISGGVVSFNKITYQADRQNWSVSAASNGFVYFANHQGLLQFDGTNWQLYQLPNKTILRAVKVCNDSVIYTSGYMEMGYWKSNKFGQLQYHSLSGKAKNNFTKNTEFWNIAVTDSFVYFHSFSSVLVYHADTVTQVELPHFISVMNKVNNKVLAAVRDVGIFEINGISPEPLIKGDFFQNKLVQFLIPFQNNQLLIGTASHGIFLWNGNEIRQWNSQWTDYFIKNELNRGFFSQNGNVVVGTITDGIVVFDENGNLRAKINTQNGLSNNTVLGIETDEWQNLWLALDDGIGFISLNQNNGFATEKIPGVGAIYSTAIFEGKIYLGTNQGLFMKSMDSEEDDFSMVEQTQGQVWDCQIIGENLWVGHNTGTFKINGGKIQKISNQAGGFIIKPDPKNPDLLIQGTYNDLVVYKKTGDTFNFRNQINGFSDLVRYIEIDHLGNIWASHLHRGLFKITTDDNRETVKDVVYFGEKQFTKNQTVNVFKVENRIVFTTGNQIYTYDDLNDTILVHTALNNALEEYATAHRIVEAPNHYYWFITKKSIGLFSVLHDSVTKVKEFPVSLFSDTPLVDGFENIFPTDENTAFLCLQNGIANLDASGPDTINILSQFSPVLRQFDIFSNSEKVISLALNSNKIRIKNKFQNIRLRFSFPYLSELPVLFQYQLAGLTSEWAVPTTNAEFRFERLPAGKYLLKVKVVDPWANESQVFTIPFEVLPAWYASTFAMIFYLLLLAVVLMLFRRWGIRMTKRKQQQQQEEKEKEIIRLRNAKLRDEIEHKSKELASSTMSIIKKNEFLMDLKEIISKHKSELGSRYPDKYYNFLNKKIDENISNQDDWQVFENNFKRAHEQFFEKMKTAYPQLTQSDLRLCAYLHMNLSSKEIAPLLGISFRGVENHRYRLRKKMNLEHDENLVDIINGA
jgi:DNA-binding CsgD family transcriptional regulator